MYFALLLIAFISSFARADSGALVEEGSACHQTAAKAAASVTKEISRTVGAIDKCDNIGASEIEHLSCKHDIILNVT